MIASYTENGEVLPAELRDIEFEYKYDIASVFNFFDFINVSKSARWGWNKCWTYASIQIMQYVYFEAQVRIIEDALHNIGRELSAISL